jgi:hypothetical protein
MKRTFETSGFYGSGHTPCTIYVYENRNGSYWYCVEDSINVNCTYQEITPGTNVEEVQDVDFFTASSPINSEEELQEQVES